MPMRPAVRKLALTIHIVACLGWMGAVAAFIVLDVATVTSDDVSTLRAAYVGMQLITIWAIVPLAYASFASGLVMSLGTKWGLFRHWWVVLTLVLTAFATAVLVAQLPIIEHRADLASDPATTDETLREAGNLLLHSIGGTVVLLVVTVLNVYKPRGLTRYGWRKQQAEAAASSDNAR